MKLASLPFILCAFAGCFHSAIERFDARGYINKDYAYRVLGPAPSLLGGDWIVDNFYESKGRWREKDGPAYRIQYEFDTDGDGSLDTKRELPLYDLRFKHRRHNASVWLRATPFSTEWRERELRVLVQAYVDSIAGGGYEAARVEHDRVRVEERRFAAEFVERAPARLAGLDAYDATIDVANLDQIRLTPTERKTRVRLVFVNLPTNFQTYRNGAPGVALPLVLIVGYANSPGEFSADMNDFENLLDRIEIQGNRGYSRQAPAPGVAATPPPVSVPADSAVPSSVSSPQAAPSGEAPPITAP
ncbi:MAG: hypothetical protein ACOY0T_19820 [Myxococcota bacterium]